LGAWESPQVKDVFLMLHEQAGRCCEVMDLFQRSVLILDEVDLILHPLRSELNWPLGVRRPLDFTSEKHAVGMRWELPLHLLVYIYIYIYIYRDR